MVLDLGKTEQKDAPLFASHLLVTTMLNNDLDERLVAGDDDSDPATRDDDAEKEEVPPLKSDSVFRWAVLSMSCMAMIGNYYCFDNPTALHTQVNDHMGWKNDDEYSLLYSIYSLPNCVLPFFGRFGICREEAGFLLSWLPTLNNAC